MEYIYTFWENPTSWKRPRFNKKAIWNSQKASMIAHGFEFKRMHGNKPPLEGPLTVYFEFRFPIPKKVPLKQLPQWIRKPYEPRPDLSNTIKYIEDVAHLYAEVFLDDCQIVHLTSFKCYDIEPCTLMVIAPFIKLHDSKIYDLNKEKSV